MKKFLQAVMVETGDINVAAAMLEVLCAYGDSAGDLALVEEVINRNRHYYTEYAGSIAVKEIRRRGRLIPWDKGEGRNE